MRTSGTPFDLPSYERPCSWIATGDRRELRRALPVAGAAVPLSQVAWQLSDPRVRRLIAPGDALLPWGLTPDGHDEALAVQRAAIARGDRPMRLDARRDAVLGDFCHQCLGPRAVAALLPLLRLHGIAVSGVAASGARAPIDALLLSQLVIDLARDTAWTLDNALRWRALAATRAAEAVPAPRREPLPKRPERRTVQAELARWYRETYPAGHPVGRKLDALAAEAAPVLGRTVSGRTMRRAVLDVRRTTAAT